MAENESLEQQLPLGTAGQRLRHAREAAGLSLDDVSARTKIAARHLVSIEEDRFADLAGRTYAVGFSRSYARAVGLDEAEIADAVRFQLAAEEEPWPAPQHDTFEPGDPARVPPARLAWIAGLGALAVILLLFIFWRSFIDPAGSLPDLTRDEPPQAPASAAPEAASEPSPAAAQGAVVFTALEPDIWVKFYDASGTQLFQKEMALGESYTVPADADGPLIWTARPDALQITVGGSVVPKLEDKPVTLRDVPVSAAALLGRSKDNAESEGADAGEAAAPKASAPARLAPRPAGMAPAPRSEPLPRPSASPVPPSPAARATPLPAAPASPARSSPGPVSAERSSRPAATHAPAPPSGESEPAPAPSGQNSTVSD